MPRFKVLLTDYAWNDLDIECAILSEIDAELVVAPSGDLPTLVSLAGDVDGIMTNWAKVPSGVIGASPKLRIVSRLGIGLDNIDVAFATSRKIVVTNVPDYCLIEVAEHCAGAAARAVAQGRVSTITTPKTAATTCKAGPTLRRIEGQTLGIVGLGNIGRKLAEKALAIGLRVIAYSRSRNQSDAWCRVRRAGRAALAKRLRLIARARDPRDSAHDRRRPIGPDEALGVSDQHGPRRPDRPRGLGRGPRQADNWPARRSTCKTPSRPT